MKKNLYLIIASFVIIVALVFLWAFLTRKGFISNFLGWEILCSERLENTETIEKVNEVEANKEKEVDSQTNSQTTNTPTENQKVNPENNQEIPETPQTENKNNSKPVKPVSPKNEPILIKKPVIYLYPQEKQNVKVQLNYQGEIIADFPNYDKQIKGWFVTAYPDGKIINHKDNNEYSYLFWEGKPEKPINWDLSEGFIVKGEDIKEFLQSKLAQIGLTPKEYNEFIVYWFPLMQDNKYNLIHFAGEQYTNIAPLAITPKPDSTLRVFMVYKPLEESIEIKEQKLETFNRKGFSVIEWGGTEAE